MAYHGGFQRLGQTDDIASQNPILEYSDNTPNQYWQGNNTGYFPDQDARRMSQTTRKPVAGPIQTPEQPLIKNYFDVSPPVPVLEKPHSK